jgi:hypothetical protein
MNQSSQSGSSNVDVSIGPGFEALPDSAHQLCARCKGIDWEAVFNQVVDTDPEFDGLYVTDPASVEPVCPLCQLFVGDRRYPSAANYYLLTQIKLNEYELRAYYSKQTFKMDSDFNVRQDRRSGSDMVLLAYILKSADAKEHQRLLSLQPIQRVDEVLAVRRIQPYKFDLSLASRWVNHCHEFHTGDCALVQSESFRPLRVIDCESKPLRVMNTPVDCKYTALSYLWGPSVDVTLASNSSAQERIVPGLPKTVADSIEVTRRLSLRYLWVDRYCIDQLNEADKALQIGHMDKIYAGAYVTIIAAAGDGPDYGLPGINGTVGYRDRQKSVRIGRLCITDFQGHEDGVHYSKWDTRAWTYQEGVLSKHRLIFTEREVCYECDKMKCTESLNVPLDYDHKRTGYYWDIFESRIFAQNTIYAPSLMTHIRIYYERSMTNPGDKLNAIQGILRAYENHNPLLHNLQGVLLFPSRQKNVFALVPTETRYLSVQESLMSGLLWCHTSAGKREERFPSWSWAGWAGGHLDNSLATEKRVLNSKGPTDSSFFGLISVEDINGQLHDFPVEFHSLREFLTTVRTKFLLLDVFAIPINLEKISEDKPSFFREPWGSLGNILIRFHVTPDDFAYWPLSCLSQQDIKDNDDSLNAKAEYFAILLCIESGVDFKGKPSSI